MPPRTQHFHHMSPNTHIFSLTSASVKNHKYCLRLALANSTGTQPATSESNSDLRVMESPGGAGQYCARWNIIICDDAFTTCENVMVCMIV